MPATDKSLKRIYSKEELDNITMRVEMLMQEKKLSRQQMLDEMNTALKDFKGLSENEFTEFNPMVVHRILDYSHKDMPDSTGTWKVVAKVLDASLDYLLDGKES